MQEGCISKLFYNFFCLFRNVKTAYPRRARAAIMPKNIQTEEFPSERGIAAETVAVCDSALLGAVVFAGITSVFGSVFVGAGVAFFGATTGVATGTMTGAVMVNTAPLPVIGV